MSFSSRAASAGTLAAFVGSSSSFAIIIAGLIAVGASREEAASGLMALSIAMGVCAMLLSYLRRMPISIAWSTPGAALLATGVAPEGGFAVAVGAFIVSGMLIVLSGVFKPLGRWVAAIPAPLANAMLAGVLLQLCLAPVKAVSDFPVIGLAIFTTWALVGLFNRVLAMPAAVIVAVAGIFFTRGEGTAEAISLVPVLTFIAPDFTLAGMIGIGVPLFIVTMASQNIPGMAVLHANGYRPDANPLFSWTGAFSLLAAPFGGHAINLAAITAVLCANEDADPDPAKRWQAAFVAGAWYIVFGFVAGAATAFIGSSPPILIEAVAGLALLGALGSSLSNALADTTHREAAIVTFLTTASGVAFFGVSGAFWGLLAGGALMALQRLRSTAKG
ncbi:MAG: benzoate/H(+) symporter BenE family transporter [Rhodospirillales bacterium]